ncbi:hypothetical protein CXQ80_13190 [Pseudomonas sp. 02C 26]|uniref:hypothetical protein n=1 Tax=Pseudomonas sp. 02C 26 TaxID=2054914 RepID=UPI000C6EA26D|nr:hypothetical protein [Pseudomonas sp. 02C 26]AUF96721.1 hypothetical protein CXQ80_13190 [Pseudomonas sp. 02C 26]
MTKQVINLGTAPAGAGGDDRRSAWIKARANFTELYNWLANLSQTDDQATALPAALPVAKGGTGRGTLALLLADLLGAGAYGRANALGTVSQASGVPTGALMEFGSNANGQYYRFANGLQVCINQPSTTLALGANDIKNMTINFAAAFSSRTFFAHVQGSPNASADWYGCIYVANASALSITPVFRNGPNAQSIVEITAVAVGRWYQ